MKPKEALERLNDVLIAEGRSDNTIRAYLSDCEQFFKITHTINLIEADYLADCLRYIRVTRPLVKPATTNRRIASLRAMGTALGFPPVLPNYKSPRATQPPPHPLSDGMPGVDAMIASARTAEHRALVALCGKCGLRVSEARSVRACDFSVDPEGQRWLTVRGKGDKERLVPVVETVWMLMIPLIARAQVSTRPLIRLKDRSARQAIKLIGERALGADVASHDLRMTFGTKVYEETLDLRTTQELLGHESSVTTEGYTKVSSRAKVAAVKAATS